MISAASSSALRISKMGGLAGAAAGAVADMSSSPRHQAPPPSTSRDGRLEVENFDDLVVVDVAEQTLYTSSALTPLPDLFLSPFAVLALRS
jgi:hypothetical protein